MPGSAAAVVGIVGGVITMETYAVMPENSVGDCTEQFEGTNRTTAGAEFCDCVHNRGLSLEACLENYEKSPDDFRPQE